MRGLDGFVPEEGDPAAEKLVPDDCCLLLYKMVVTRMIVSRVERGALEPGAEAAKEDSLEPGIGTESIGFFAELLKELSAPGLAVGVLAAEDVVAVFEGRLT